MVDVLDTMMLILILRHDPRARRWFGRYRRRRRQVTCSVVSRAEVLAGMREGEELETWRLLSRLRWAPVTEAVADKAG